MNSLVLFDSLSGNTEKVAKAIYDTATIGTASHLLKIDKETNINIYDYGLIFIGSPVIDWLPTKTMMDFVKGKMKEYNGKGLIKPSSPIIPGKFGVCFGTFGGPHIGKREAQPMTMWLRSFLEHLGYIVLDEWLFVGEFKNRENLNKAGRMGNIAERPNAADLATVQGQTEGILASLQDWIA